MDADRAVEAYYADIRVAADSRLLAARFGGQYSRGSTRGDYEAVGGKSGWGVRHVPTGEFIVDGHDTQAAAWEAAEQEICFEDD